MNTTPSTDAFNRLLEPVVDILTPDVARRIGDLRADEDLQVRLNDLAYKATHGQLTEGDRREYEDYVDAIDFLGILQAKSNVVMKQSIAG